MKSRYDLPSFEIARESESSYIDDRAFILYSIDLSPDKKANFICAILESIRHKAYEIQLDLAYSDGEPNRILHQESLIKCMDIVEMIRMVEHEISKQDPEYYEAIKSERRNFLGEYTKDESCCVVHWECDTNE